MVPVGKGEIDFKSIFQHADRAGLVFLAEQDETGPLKPLEAIIDSERSEGYSELKGC